MHYLRKLTSGMARLNEEVLPWWPDFMPIRKIDAMSEVGTLLLAR